MKNRVLADYAEEKQLTFAVTTNMTRQYKAMQEQLLNKIDQLNNTILELQNELGELQYTILHVVVYVYTSFIFCTFDQLFEYPY